MDLAENFENLPGARTPETRHCRKVYQMMLLMFGILILYWLFLFMICGMEKITSCDQINRVLIDNKTMKFGGWSLSHVIFYYIIGLLFPDCMLLAMTIGVLWEIFEEVLGMFKPINIGITKSNGLQYSEGWIRGSVSDVIYNFIGFVAGALTVKYFLNGKPPQIPWLNT